MGDHAASSPAPEGLPSLNARQADAAEINEAFQVCERIIDAPPEEYRIVKQAILGLAYLSSRRKDLRIRAMLKILQVIRSPRLYRSNPRRYAVHTIAAMTYYDNELTDLCVRMFTDLIQPQGEASQYVRKGAFVALSRIGRRYPALQNPVLIPLFVAQYENAPKLKESVLWGIIIGLGRMAQSNAQLRAQFAPEWLRWCRHPAFRMRWAGIKGLGHACCPIGDVPVDHALATACFSLAVSLIGDGGVTAADDDGGVPDIAKAGPCRHGAALYRRQEVYLVQYAATQALSLLLRSNPDTWWPKIAPVFCGLLLDPRLASMIKATVMITFGKITFYLREASPCFVAIRDLLLRLTENENILLAEPATYAMANLALVHEAYYGPVKQLLRKKFGHVALAEASPTALLYYLKTWCKFVARDYEPILNLCSRIIGGGGESAGQVFSGVAESVAAADPVDHARDDEAAAEGGEGVAGGGPDAPSPDPHAIIREICTTPEALAAFCRPFGPTVLESVLLVATTDGGRRGGAQSAGGSPSQTLGDPAFCQNLRALIEGYTTGARHPAAAADDRETCQLVHWIGRLAPGLREAAVAMLRFPHWLTDSIGLANIKVSLIEGRHSCEAQGARSEPGFPPYSCSGPVPPQQGDGAMLHPFQPNMHPYFALRPPPHMVATPPPQGYHHPQEYAPLYPPPYFPQIMIDPAMGLWAATQPPRYDAAAYAMYPAFDPRFGPGGAQAPPSMPTYLHQPPPGSYPSGAPGAHHNPGHAGFPPQQHPPF